MRASEVAFVGSLVHRFPVLLPLLQDHLDTYDELLPHVFLGDFTRWMQEELTLARPPSELKDILGFLETEFESGSTHQQELISVSFLENLPRPGEPAFEFRQELGPSLRRQLDLIG
ncbi:MAG: hypothetical protein MI919_22365 [Holophagales bacterium]|nr:hypothetical protein [Holophagales bacterium]